MHHAPQTGDAASAADEPPREKPLRTQNLRPGQPIELQGEYVDSGHAYPTQDNDGHPPLSVLHFTHHPVGYVIYDGQHYG